MSGRSFMELESWKKARVLRTEMKDLAEGFPSTEKYRLSDQLIRASRSITANIAEGHGRFHFQENIQFCRMSRASAIECIDHLTVALDCNYIDSEAFKSYKTEFDRVVKILNGYIKFLSTQKKSAQA